MNKLWTVILNIFFWGPPLITAVYCWLDSGRIGGLIAGVILGALVAAGETAIMVVVCMIWESLTPDDPND